MPSFPIGDSEYDMEVVTEGFRRGAPPHPPSTDFLRDDHTEGLELNPVERNDLAAFQNVGWRFRQQRSFEAEEIEVENPNGRGEIQRGLLARHRKGLVILQDRLVVQLKLGVTPQRVKKRFAKYTDYWPVERAENIFEVQIRSTGQKLEPALFSELRELLEEKDSPLGEVIFAEPSLLYHLERPGDDPVPDRAPQWQWDTIKLTQAWSIAGRGAKVRVAVIDYGFHLSDEIPTDLPVVLNDQGRVIPDVDMPQNLHGSLCAGLVGARLGGLQVNGAAPECELILVSVPEPGILSQVALSRAIRLCAAPSKYLPGSPRGADVISCSLGLQRRNWELGGALRRAIDFAIRRGRPRRKKNLGCTVVWSVYNANLRIEPNSINGYKPILSISQSNRNDERVDSGYGDGLDCIAPGVDVAGIICGPVCGTSTGSGSSFAAPCAAGVAALVLAVNPDLSSDQVAKAITQGCDPVGRKRVPNEQVGAGRLNAVGAVIEALEMRAKSRAGKASPTLPAPSHPDSPPPEPVPL